MWLSALEINQSGAASICHRNRANKTIFACEQKPYPVTFLWGAKAMRYSVNIALTCPMPFSDVTVFKTGLKGLLTKFRSIKWIVVFHDRLLFRNNAHTVYSEWSVSKWSRLMPSYFHLPFCFLLRWMTEFSNRQTVYLSWHFCCFSSYGIKTPLVWPETWLYMYSRVTGFTGYFHCFLNNV